MSDDLSASFGAAMRGGNPLAALGGLSMLAAAPSGPAPMPDLPAWTRPMTDGAAESPALARVYAKERGAAQSELLDDMASLKVLEGVLWAARSGVLAADWREGGLASALESGEGIWLWMKIQGHDPRPWEPRVLASFATDSVPHPRWGWKWALSAWRADLVMSMRMRQLCDPGAVSRWAGVDLIDASPDCWERVLDRHEESWPARSAGDGGPVSMGLRAHALRQQLDRVQVFFEAGLAAGGEVIDWRGHHRVRVQRWRISGDRDDELALLDRPKPEHCRLPRAWLAPDAF